MKKLIYILLFISISSFGFTACSEDPYIGKYQASNSSILVLGGNNSCTIINNSYKEAFYTEGKYVIKDNDINITFNTKETNYYGVPVLKGKFIGNSIKLNDSLCSKTYIYSKE